MNYEQKCEKLQQLSPVQLCMREPGDWYVRQLGIEVKDHGILGSVSGSGCTPEEAIESHWRKVTTQLEPHEYLVRNAGRSNREAFRWEGSYWAEVDEGLRDAH